MANTHVLWNNKVLKHWVQATVMANPDAQWGKNYGFRFKPSVDDDLLANSEAVTESPMNAAHPGYKYRLYGKRSADAEPETETNAGIPRLYYGSPYAYSNYQNSLIGKRSVDAKPETDARKPRWWGSWAYYGRR
jgi:hypothetical protein